MMIKKSLRLINLLIIIAIGLVLSACMPYASSYEGDWIGVNKKDPTNNTIYDLKIKYEEDDTFTLTIQRIEYKLVSGSSSNYRIVRSHPFKAKGIYDLTDGGTMHSDFGDLYYDVSSFILEFDGIKFVKKAPNAQFKLLPILKDAIRVQNPRATFNDEYDSY